MLDRSMSDNPSDWPIFSHSQFQVWDRCAFLYRFTYVQKWTKNQKENYFEIGEFIHSLLHVYYETLKTEGMSVAQDKILEKIQQILDEEVKTYERLKNLTTAGYLVTRYANEFSPSNDLEHVILDVEHHFTTPLKTDKGRNFIIQGYIDLLTKVNGIVCVWDHKSMYQAKWWSPLEVALHFQTPLYGACLREHGVDVKKVIINQYNTYDYKDKDKKHLTNFFKREEVYKTPAEYDGILQEAKLMVDEIIDNHQTPRRSLRKECGHCRFAEPCNISLKGIDPTPVLRTNFIQKDTHEVPLDFGKKVELL